MTRRRRTCGESEYRSNPVRHDNQNRVLIVRIVSNRLLVESVRFHVSEQFPQKNVRNRRVLARRAVDEHQQQQDEDHHQGRHQYQLVFTLTRP
jgi:hypothetical protein